MGGIGFDPPSTAGHEPVAPGAVEHRPYPVSTYTAARRPSGGLVASVADLLRFADGLWDDAEVREPLAERPGGDRPSAGCSTGATAVSVTTLARPPASSRRSRSSRPARGGRCALEQRREAQRRSAVVDTLPEAAADVPRWAPPLSAVALDDLGGSRGGTRGPTRRSSSRPRGRAGGRLSERDPFTGETTAYPEFLGRPRSRRTFAALRASRRAAPSTSQAAASAWAASSPTGPVTLLPPGVAAGHPETCAAGSRSSRKAAWPRMPRSPPPSPRASRRR